MDQPRRGALQAISSMLFDVWRSGLFCQLPEPEIDVKVPVDFVYKEEWRRLQPVFTDDAPPRPVTVPLDVSPRPIPAGTAQSSFPASSSQPSDAFGAFPPGPLITDTVPPSVFTDAFWESAAPTGTTTSRSITSNSTNSSSTSARNAKANRGASPTAGSHGFEIPLYMFVSTSKSGHAGHVDVATLTSLDAVKHVAPAATVGYTQLFDGPVGCGPHAAACHIQPAGQRNPFMQHATRGPPHSMPRGMPCGLQPADGHAPRWIGTGISPEPKRLLQTNRFTRTGASRAPSGTRTPSRPRRRTDTHRGSC